MKPQDFKKMTQQERDLLEVQFLATATNRNLARTVRNRAEYLLSELRAANKPLNIPKFITVFVS